MVDQGRGLIFLTWLGVPKWNDYHLKVASARNQGVEDTSLTRALRYLIGDRQKEE